LGTPFSRYAQLSPMFFEDIFLLTVFKPFLAPPDADSKMEMVGENTFDPKTHHRCRRRKHDYRMVDSLR
jgi:hypothetical protein